MAKVVSSDVKPTFISKPDMRFATTFLSSQYRKYAVHGEAIMDKATGELFMKRVADGRVVSFHQNKKYIHDLMLELRVLLTNNEGFTYPKENENAYYLSTDYDLVAINSEELSSIVTDDTHIPNGERSITNLRFPISTECNGFFCRPMTRDTDKIIVEYLTNQYNTRMENYTGINITYKAEAEKFRAIEKWKDSNVILTYTVIVTYGDREKSYLAKDYIRCNEEMFVPIPVTKIAKDFPNGADTITVEINSMEYYKLRFILDRKNDFEGVSEEIDKFLYLDKNIFVNYLSIMSFVDDSTDITLLGNEYLIAALDIPYVRRYMSKLAKLQNSSELILSIDRPTEDDWSANTIWAERIRDVYRDGFTIDRNSEVDLKRMEAFLSKKPHTIITKISENLYEQENAYLEDKDKLEYVATEIDHKLEEFERNLKQKIEDAIISIDGDALMSGSSERLYINVERKERSDNNGSTTPGTTEP